MPDRRQHETATSQREPAVSSHDRDLVTVLETADPSLLPVATSLLESAGIPHLVQGGRALGLLPLGPFGARLFRRALAAAIRVPADRADEARALLEVPPEGIETPDAPDGRP